MTTRPRLLIATANSGKVAEYWSLLAGLDCQLLSLRDAAISGDVAENGATYAENARIKAVAYATRSGLVTLADDSGLEVDALGGEPGIYSARYAGEGATDAERVAFLLHKLEGVVPEHRGARFVCVIAIALPDGEVTFCRGECSGVIAAVPRGATGFGYDPVFLLPDRGLTVAELEPGEKNRVSHRGRAAALARDVIRDFIDAGRCR